MMIQAETTGQRVPGTAGDLRAGGGKEGFFPGAFTGSMTLLCLDLGCPVPRTMGAATQYPVCGNLLHLETSK
jgi:hypothetical protein